MVWQNLEADPYVVKVLRESYELPCVIVAALVGFLSYLYNKERVCNRLLYHMPWEDGDWSWMSPG